MSEQVFDSAVDAALGSAPPPDTQPTGPSAVDSAVDSVLGPLPKDRTATAWRAQQLGTSPEAATQAVGLAKQTGLDPTYTAQNLDAVQKQAQQRDMAAHLAEAPAMAAYSDRSAAHAASLSDSYREMSTLEWLITGKWDLVLDRPDVPYGVGLRVSPPAAVRAFQLGLVDVQHAYYSGKEALGFGTPEDAAEIATLERQQQQDLGAQSIPGRALVGTARFVPSMLGIMGAGLVGGPEGVAAALIAQNFGPLYRRLKQEHPDMPDEKASAYAGAGAGVAAKLAATPEMAFLKNLPGVKEAVGRIGADAVAKTIPQAALSFVVQGSKHVVLGGLTMAAQSGVNQATVELAGGNPDWDRVGEATSRGWESGLVDMGALALLTPGRELLADVGRLQAARQERARLTAMEEVAKTAKLAQRAPAEAEQALAGAAGRPGADSTVYIDHEALSKNPEALAAVTQAVGQAAIDEAAATKGDVAVPIEKYLTQLVADGHAEKLRDDVKLSADGWTQRQADEWQEAFHGTPATFAKFDLSKVGTGKGQQTRGSGIYLGEVGAAEFHRIMLTPPGEEAGGNVYRVAVPKSEALLDYDKPLSEQPAGVLKLLDDAGLLDDYHAAVKVGDTEVLNRVTGQTLYEKIVREKDDAAKASEAFRQAGIPGLQYAADEGSAKGETRNFVIWDESKMRILTEGEPLPGTKTEPVLPPAKVLRQYADGMAAKKPIGDLQPGKYKQQERRATESISQLAEALATEKATPPAGTEAAPTKEAGPSKAQQLTELENARTMARHMAAAEEATKKRADAEVTYLTSRGTDAQQAIFERSPAAYREAADSILSAVGLGGKATDGAMDTLLGRMKADLAQPLFNVDALRALIAKPLEVHRLTLGEVQNVANAIRQIRYVARRSTEVSIGGIGGGAGVPPPPGGAGAGQPPEPPREPLQAVVDRLREESKDLPDQPKIPSDEATVGTLRKLDNIVSGGQAALRAPERLWAKFGATGQSIFEGYVQRRNYRDSLDALVTKYYAEHWDEKMPDAVKARRYDILDLSGLPMPEKMDPTRSRTWLMKLMLHMGNAGNRMRTLEGYGWTFDQVMDEAGKHLNRDELGFVQSIWDFNEQHLRPLIWEQERRMEGAEPKTVEPMPFTVTLADGSKVEMQGGYFPLKKDLRAGVQPEPSPAGPARFLTPDYQSASTSHSFTEDRAERAKYIVNLQWNDVPGHIQQVIHDLAFREYTMDVARLLDDPGFQQVAVQKQGTAAYNALVSDLYVMANGRAEHSAQNMNKVVGAVRSRVATASVVGSIPVLMGQFFHPVIAIAAGEIPAMAGARAFVQGFSPSVREEARLVFPEVQHRYQTNQANYRQMLGNIGPRGNVGPVGRFTEQVRVIAHGLQQAVDDIVTTQIALASHSELTGQGLAGEEAVTKAGQTVRRLMPTHDIAEQSALLRDRGVIGSLLMFHGFMNKLYNIAADRGGSAQAAYRQGDWTGIARNTGQILGMLAVAGLGRYIMGHGAKDDEDAATYAQREALLMPSELLPFGREIMQPLVDSMLTDKTLATSLKNFDVRFPTLGYYIQQAHNIGTLVDENAENEDRVAAGIELALAGLKLPRQPLRTGKYLYDVATDRERPQGPFDFGAGLAYGSRPNQPSNPGRDLQAALR